MGRERQEAAELRGLRELVREQLRQLNKVRGLARRARLALCDHDLEMVRNFLSQIADVRSGGRDSSRDSE